MRLFISSDIASNVDVIIAVLELFLSVCVTVPFSVKRDSLGQDFHKQYQNNRVIDMTVYCRNFSCFRLQRQKKKWNLPFTC